MVCPYSMGVWGGVQAQVLGLARTLRQQGVDVQVLAPCDGLPPETWVTPLGNSMPYAQNGSLAPVAPDPAAQLRVLGIVRDERFDLLHLHEPLAPGPTLTSLVVKPVPLVGTFHANGNIAVYRYLRPLLRRLVTKLDCKVAVSSEAAGMARRHLGGAYETLFNGIELSRFAGGEAVAPLGTDPSKSSVFFLSRHEPRKGLSVLLEASRLMPDDIEIWIGGSGPETSALKSQHQDNNRLFWLGDLSEGEKAQRLAAADAFCAPALHGESFGVVLLEGMAAGTPVVASDLEAFRLTSRGGRDAHLFPTGSPEELAKALFDTLAGGVDVAARVASGQQRANEFSMDRLARAYVDRYQRVLL
ncbi:MAG: phosphatidylinositol alpha-mannosyltransferase [Acidimicrobiales bacterium]|jgi:phosphatidyl-myo-inositol alpha-mannosyltransferase